MTSQNSKNFKKCFQHIRFFSRVLHAHYGLWVTCSIVFTYCKYSSVHLHFPGPILSPFPPPLGLQQTAHSSSPAKASGINPRTHFQNCTQSEVTMALHSLGSFRKKTNCILLFWFFYFLTTHISSTYKRVLSIFFTYK